jgi:MFS transporter, putative metabolite transport protein
MILSSPADTTKADIRGEAPDRSERNRGLSGKTVQEYIDETPAWPDGTESPSTPMTMMQWRIWGLATAGKFFEGMVVFMTGVALPLIVKEFGLTAMQKGAVSAATLFSILVGAAPLGGLADHFGRKRMFIAEMAIFLICLCLLVISPTYFWLLLFLFGMGVALGCDYPTAHMVISESIPSKDRGKLVLSAFGFQAVGALAGTMVGYLILYKEPALDAWRWMYATAVIPALLVFLGRFFISDSGHWLVSRGRLSEAETEVSKLLKRIPPTPRLRASKVCREKDNQWTQPQRYGTHFNSFEGSLGKKY